MFKEYLATELNQPNAWETLIMPKIENLVVTSLKSWPKEGHRNYSFELLGFDILLDEHLKPYLLEINTNPGEAKSLKVLKKTRSAYAYRYCTSTSYKCTKGFIER